MKITIKLVCVILLSLAFSLISSDLRSSSQIPKNTAHNKKPATRAQRTRLPATQDIEPGLIRVKLTEETATRVARKAGKSGLLRTRSASQTLKVGITSLDTKLSAAKAIRMKRVFPYHPRYEARQRAMGLHLWYEIEIDTLQPALEVCKELNTDPNIKLAEPVLKQITTDVKGKRQNGKKQVKGKQDEPVLPLSIQSLTDPKILLSSKTQATPFSVSARNYEENPPVNDPRLLEQWHYYNYGQVFESLLGNSVPEADIDLFDAWKITMGKPNVIVSVHDQGVDWSHPDLQGNMWVNEAELNGEEGSDDDGNGYVDDIYGYNFYDNGAIQPGSHGSHVAGTISAVNNNGIGVAGIAGGSGHNDGVRIMSCQILNSTQNQQPNIPASYVYAANNGAVISQNSWEYQAVGYYEEALLDAIDYFIEWAGKDENGNPLPGTPMRGGIVIFAAGNSGSDGEHYPGYYSSCFTVGSTGPWNEKPDYSNFGPWVDIAAPGGDIDAGVEAAGVLSCGLNGNYEFMQGTSMACPHVSGVAALILSAYGHKTYTPEMLKNRLIQSAIPWKEVNPECEGILGVGLLNAARALLPDDGVAPKAITDLALKNAGYEFLTLTCTAPADEDNESAHSYEIRYSKEKITAGNFSDAPVLFQLAKPAGSTEEITIDHLEGETTYYIAIRSSDIWGNVSEISNVLEARTTIAPQVVIQPDSLEIHIAKASENPIGENQFTIGNQEGGALRYALDYAFVSTPGTQQGVFTHILSNIANRDIPYAGTFGEDGSARFLAATRFNVADVEEFTLTQIQAAVLQRGINSNGEPAYNSTPFYIQVIRGGKTPAEGELLHNYPFVVPSKFYLLAFGQDITFSLAESYRFKKGEHFWIVLDFPQSFYMPIAFNAETKSASTNELYSNDGQTWEELNDFTIGDLRHNYAYRIFALSDLPREIKDVIRLTPATGVLAAGDQSDIQVSVNATQLREGAYKATLFTANNDPSNPLVRLPLKFTVDGHHIGIRSAKTLSLGNAVEGNSINTQFTVYNDSLGILKIDTIISSSPEFTVSPNKQLQIQPGDSAVFQVTFTAPSLNEAGTNGNTVYVSRLKFQSNATQGDYEVIADAASIERPIAVLDKTEETVILPLGEERKVTFNLKNEGKYRLDYIIKTDKTTDYDYSDLLPGVEQYYGKRYNETFNSIEYDPAAIDITNDIKGSKLTTYPLPFSFSSYGIKYDTITISGDGRIALGDRKELYGGCDLGYGQGGTPATLFPFFFSRGQNVVTGAGGKAFLKKEADKVIVEYTKVCDYQKGTASATLRVQTVLYSDGRVDLGYKDFSPGASPLAGCIAISDPEGIGGLGIWVVREREGLDNPYIGIGELNGFAEYSIYEGPEGRDTLYWKEFPPFINYYEDLMVKVTPNQTFTKDITPAAGHLMPGEDTDITLTLRADQDMQEGILERIIPIETNDPQNRQMQFKVNIQYQSEARPHLELAELDFGKVGKNITQTLQVSLRNLGGKPFTAHANLVEGSHFQLASSSTECAGLGVINYSVAFTPTEEKAYEDVINFQIGNDTTLTLRLKGEGVKSPQLNIIRPSSDMNFTVRLDAPKNYIDTSITIQNTGEAPLDYNLMTTEWIKQTSAVPASGNDKKGYFWSDNFDDHSISYNWVWENPEEFNPLNKEDGIGYFDKGFDLPWEFEFYGEKYTRCYVNGSGLIVFNRDDVKYSLNTTNIATAGNTIIPKNDEVNGFIGALAGSYDHRHCYYEQIGEGDTAKVVFTWQCRPFYDLVTSQDTNYIHFQTILFPDGSMKFQYKRVENAYWRDRTTIGIENRNGDDGLNICYSDKDYLRDGLAIAITPSKVKTLAAGASEKINLRVESKTLWDGQYKGEIRIRSNDPEKPFDITPVNLTVVGSTNTSYFVDGTETRQVDFGTLTKYDYPESYIKLEDEKYMYNSKVSTYVKRFTIKNTGSRTLELNRKNVTGITDNFPIAIFGVKNLLIEPNQTYEVELRLNPMMPSDIPADNYAMDYIIQDKCYGDDCAELYGYTLKGEEPAGMFGGTKEFYYKADTLHILFNLEDITNEQMNTEKNTYDKTFHSREGSESFTFSVSNPALDSTYWRDMHKNNQKPLITRQANLDYKVLIEDITESEYKALLEGEKETTKASPLSLNRPEAPVIVDFAKIDYDVSNIHPRTRAGETSPEFVDSLGYFQFESYYSGYLAKEAGKTFSNYVRYQSGEAGFNLTHLTAMMAKVDNFPEIGYEVEMKILSGKQAETADEIYHQTFSVNFPEAEKFYPVLIELNKNVYISPNQYFWVVFVNKINTAVLSMVWNNKDYTQELKESFMLDNEEVFGYVADLTGYAEGWTINCWSTEKIETPANWITANQTEGNVSVGAKDDITVSFSPAHDPNQLATRYAKITLNSNDSYPYGADSVLRSGLTFENSDYNPASPKVNFDDFVKDRGYILVRMRVNQGPEIFLENRRVEMEENSDTTLYIHLYDVEKDAIGELAYELINKTPSDPEHNTEPELEVTAVPATGNDTMSYAINLRTDFEAAGTYEYKFKVADAQSISSELTFTLNVQNTNRAPQRTVDTLLLVTEQQSKEVDLNGYFADPDREVLSFEVKNLDENQLAVSGTEHEINVYGWKEGTGKIEVKATDPAGLSITDTLDVKVEAKGTEPEPEPQPQPETNFTRQVKAYPNPATNVLHVQCSADVEGEVVLRLYGMNGGIVRAEKTVMSAGVVKELDVTSLPAGMYILEIEYKQTRINTKVIKQ